VLLRHVLAGLASGVGAPPAWTLVFEYEPPRERGRHPDAVILTYDMILVLEFKETAAATRATAGGVLT
jgi:hypothetical protein